MTRKPAKNHRGSVGIRHNTVQNMLVDILEERTKAWVEKEKEVESMLDYHERWVIDVADLTDRKHPVYYEVESDQSRTASTKAKQKALAKHTRIDLVIIPVWEIEEDWSLGRIEEWLRGLVH